MRERERLKLLRERGDLPDDEALVDQAREMDDLEPWEREAVDRAHERVYRYGRALFERQRSLLEGIVRRRDEE